MNYIISFIHLSTNDFKIEKSTSMGKFLEYEKPQFNIFLL